MVYKEPSCFLCEAQRESVTRHQSCFPCPNGFIRAGAARPALIQLSWKTLYQLPGFPVRMAGRAGASIRAIFVSA
ncbi:MAG: hypothetical protein ABJA78_12695 [Ferruginibacter sp.]